MASHLDLEEQEQIDQLKHFWNRWGNLMTWTLIVVLGAYAAWNGWQWWQRRNATQAAVLFDSVEQAATAKDRVDTALSRLELMVDERLRAETARAEDLARRLSRLEKEHDELRKVATEVEGRLERAMEYIRSLLAADQN